jgi:integrase
MPRIAKLLTEAQARRLTAEGRHVVAPFLYLKITRGGRYWEARFTDRRGRRVWRRLASADIMTLAAARREAEDMARGADVAGRAANIFGDVAERYIKDHSPGWNAVHAHQWRQTMDSYILPHLGRMKISDITPLDVAAALRPIWTSLPETARRVRGRIENVIDAGNAASGVLALNPASLKLMKMVLPKQEISDRHHEAPTLDKLREFILAIKDSRSARCLKFAAATASRTTEARQATWREINGDVWTITADRMKSSKPHRIPLCRAVIETLPDRRGDDDLVFGELSINAMRALLVKRGITWTVHGMRSTFRDWTARSGYSSDMAELALAHTTGTKTERAYFRDDLLEQRRPMMAEWAKALGIEK